MFNKICITKVAETVNNLLGVTYDGMDSAISEVAEFAGRDGRKTDRVFMYNPDAIAEWIYEKYMEKFNGVETENTLKLKMLSVFPPVTPVCFGSMYSGLKPEEHGIIKYEKPVIKVKTVFDTLPENGKKVAIVSTANDSVSMIFLNRNIDYYIYKTKEECNAKAFELINHDVYDAIILYNGDYDYNMHRFSPEGKQSLKALDENIETYLKLEKMISEKWKSHKTALAFAPDHGCHRVMGFLGSHGKNEECDMNIIHFWKII